MPQFPPRLDQQQPRGQTVLGWLMSGFLLYLRVGLACAAFVAVVLTVFAKDMPAGHKVRTIVLLTAGTGILYLSCREFERLLGRLPDAVKWWAEDLTSVARKHRRE